MATKITMPKLSDTMTEGVLVKWLKKEGEAIEAGDVIAEAESDKATMELEAFDSGILKKIIVPEGGKVLVNQTLAIIAEEDEDIKDVLQEAKKKPEVEKRPEPHPDVVEETIHAAPVKDKTAADEILTSDSVRIKASPLARKLAAEHDLDLRKLSGTGTGGRIIKRDIEAFNAQVKMKPAAERVVDRIAQEISLSTMRETIAARMTLSKTTVPHFYLTIEIDMDRAVDARRAINDNEADIKISYNDIVLLATAKALEKNPLVNGSFAGEKIILHDRIDIGFAVALDDGLITPVIRNCDRKSLGQIAREVRELSQRARDRKLTPDEYSNGTFNVSNLGMFGIEEFAAIINPPQAAVLAVGAVLQKPVVKEGEITVGHRLKMTLSCDHRIVDGAVGAVFLRDVKYLLENPLAMLL
jgi:pyruvate dehydrogenase E2 component (dihydrolipoamide acetyltransferase)